MPKLPFDVYSVKLFMSIHLVLALLANMSHMWSYNLAAALIFVWAVYKYEDNEPLYISLCTFIGSVFLDIIVLSIFAGDITQKQPYSVYRDTNRFCLGMTILGLLIKPWTAHVMMREFTRRGGDISMYIPALSRHGAGNTYQPVDGTNTIAPPTAVVSENQPPSYNTADKQPLKQPAPAPGGDATDVVPF
eukprot:m.331969 g.331969  ORF g.331969 m.331969 type:complete len:190 (-) comp16827_c0_seq1:185-754(-)